jgi:ATP-binding cassette subfamily B protein/subfamily B ATP-binding cassette protein MsbA
VCLRLFNKRIDRISQQYHETESSIYSVAHESLSAIRTVQAFAREDFEQRRFGEGAARSFEINLRLSRLQLFSSFLIGFIVTAGTVAMWWVCAQRVMDGRITVGHIWVVMAYIGMLYGPISSISFLTTTVRGAMARFRRVVEILQTTPQVADRPDAVPFEGGRGEVRFESVSFGYEPGKLVLENVSFEAKPGQLIALVGPSGVGKTTMLSLLLRFYDPLSGRVLVDGRDVREYQYQTLRRHIAIVPQEPVLFSTSVRENIAYGQPNATLEQVQGAALQAEAHEFISAMPQGYDTPAGEHGSRLSGGQRQRLALARAFLKNAPILILDEPTTALDAETEASVLRSLARLRENRTVIVVAHRLSTVRSATEILVLAEGRIAERGTHDALLARGGIYSRLNTIQAG